MDVFMEYLIKRHRDIKDYIIITLLVLCASILSVLLLVATFLVSLAMSAMGEGAAQFSSIITTVGVLLIAGIWWLCVRIIRSRDVEFEYILTNSELDVDKVMAQKSRKHVISINLRDIEIMANINDNSHNYQYKNRNENIKLYDVTGNKANGNIYFIDTAIEGENVRILFQPTSKMLEASRKYNPEKIFIYEEY